MERVGRYGSVGGTAATQVPACACLLPPPLPGFPASCWAEVYIPQLLEGTMKRTAGSGLGEGIPGAGRACAQQGATIAPGWPSGADEAICAIKRRVAVFGHRHRSMVVYEDTDSWLR